MRSQRAGRDRRGVGVGNDERPPERGLDVLARNRAGPKQPRRVAEAGDDGRFETKRAGTGVEDQIDAAVEIGKHVAGLRWAHRAGAIGRRRRQRRAGFSDQRAGDFAARDAQRQRVEPGAGEQADATAGRGRRDDRQRTRPKGAREPFGVCIEPRLSRGGLHGVEMRDQRIEGRTAFGGVNFRDRRVGGRKAGQAVNGFGRHADEPPGPQNRSGFDDRRRVGGDYPRPRARSKSERKESGKFIPARC